MTERLADYTITTVADWSARHNTPYHVYATPGLQVDTIKSLDGEISAMDVRRPLVFSAMIPDATIVEMEGIVLTKDDSLLYDWLTYRSYGLEYDLQGFFRSMPDENTVRIAHGEKGESVSEPCVHFGGKENFGHFLIQYLTKLAVLDRNPALRDLPLVVYEQTPKRFLHMLELAGYPPDRWITVDRTKENFFSNLWVLSCPFHEIKTRKMHVWRESVWHLRRLFADHLSDLTKKRSRLYVGRGDAQWRRILNEPQIIDLLGLYEFESIKFEEYPFEEQVRLVSEAEMIVMAGGASSPIVAFAPEDCIVIEIMPPGVERQWSMFVAAILGMHYMHLTGTAVPADVAREHGFDVVRDTVLDRDLFVDTIQLKKSMDKAEKIIRQA